MITQLSPEIFWPWNMFKKFRFVSWCESCSTLLKIFRISSRCFKDTFLLLPFAIFSKMSSASSFRPLLASHLIAQLGIFAKKFQLIFCYLTVLDIYFWYFYRHPSRYVCRVQGENVCLKTEKFRPKYSNISDQNN